MSPVPFEIEEKTVCAKNANKLIFCRFVFGFFSLSIQLLHHLKTLSIADMGVIPYELLIPLGQLKALNLSGNHLVNVSMQILHPVNNLDVSITTP